VDTVRISTGYAEAVEGGGAFWALADAVARVVFEESFFTDIAGDAVLALSTLIFTGSTLSSSEVAVESTIAIGHANSVVKEEPSCTSLALIGSGADLAWGSAGLAYRVGVESGEGAVWALRNAESIKEIEACLAFLAHSDCGSACLAVVGTGEAHSESVGLDYSDCIRGAGKHALLVVEEKGVGAGVTGCSVCAGLTVVEAAWALEAIREVSFWAFRIANSVQEIVALFA
jgi:hypothetical protein